MGFGFGFGLGERGFVYREDQRIVLHTHRRLRRCRRRAVATWGRAAAAVERE